MRDRAAAARTRRASVSTAAALGRLGLSASDMVVMSTMSEGELTRTLDMIERKPALAAAHWHFIFREPLLLAEDTAYVIGQGQRSLRVALLRATKLLGERGHFWTDTLELSEQYEALGICRFGTLPIALSDAIFDLGKEPAPPAEACTVGYLGDARPEKGYGEIPALVEQVAVSPQRPAVRYLIQSNFNVPGGVLATRAARLRLEHMDNFGVQTIPSAQGEVVYVQTLAACDVVLVAYTSPLYFAGSSGVLAEALATGRVPIAYDNTWAGRCIRTSAPYLDRLREMSARFALQSAEVERAPPPAAARHGVWYRPAPVAAAHPNTMAFGHRTRLAKDATHLIVRFDCELPGAADHIRLSFAYLRNGTAMVERARYLSARTGEAWALAPVPEGADGFVLTESRLHPKLDAQNHRLTLFQCQIPQDEPLGAVGVIVDRPEDLAPAVIEIARHRDHYRETARIVAAEWRERHGLRRMAELLAEASGQVCPASAAETAIDEPAVVRSAA